MWPIVLVATHLILLHTIDGHEVSISPDQVTSMHAAKEDQKNELYAEDVHCVIGLTDGKNVSTAEKCSVVKQLMEESK